MPKEQGEPWRVVRAKSNIGPDGGGFEYQLEQVLVKEGVYGQRVSWGEPLATAAESIFGEDAGVAIQAFGLSGPVTGDWKTVHDL